MKFFNLTQLQRQPLAVRMRVMWGATALLAIIFFGVWLYSTAHSVKDIDTSIGLNPQTSNQPAGSVNAANQYITVEWLEQSNNQLKIYFQINNKTSNILNFPKAEEITLTAQGQTYRTKFLQDRQGLLFPSKILSKTQKFGVAVFDNFVANTATIKFDNLYFENQIETSFNETLELDMKALNKSIEIGQ